MSQTSRSERIDELLAHADGAKNANDLARAAQVLREASQIEPQNERVKQRWLDLQAADGSSLSIVDELRAYISTGAEQDGERALQALKQTQLAPVEAVAAYELLLSANSKLSLLDSLASTLLVRQIEARKHVAEKLSSNPTDVFEQLFHRQGDETFKALTGIPLDSALWQTKDAQKNAQQDFFRLCIATLIEAGVERPARLMWAVARQLAIQPDSVAELIDEDVVDIVLSDLDIRLDSSLRTQATLSTSRLLEVTKEKGERLFAAFVATHVAKQTNDDLIVAFSAAAAVFPILPAVPAKLFMTDGFVEQLVPNLEKNSEAAAAGKRKSTTLEQSALELLSAACVDKACRNTINRYCSHWLRGLSDERKGMHKALAALILAKTSEQSVDDVTAKLSDLVINGDSEKDQAIEGLAYTSLQPKVKGEICGNATLLKDLIGVLSERPTASFGCLTIFSNLCTYRVLQSEEQKKMSQLKAYANSSTPAPEDPLDNDDHVTARCKKVLDFDIIPALAATCKQATSPTNVALVVRILVALAKEQKHRPKMAQQGAVRLLLLIHDQIAKTDKATSDAAPIERNAAHALARLLISVNPMHVFSAALPATSAVSALLPLLSNDNSSEQRDLLPAFESLLALTNLASMDDATARELIIRTAFDKIEDLLFSPNTMIQRATVELVCNLMASPTCVAKFADESKDSKRRIQILLALTDTDDLATRRAASGALAMLTEWDVAVAAVLSTPENKGVRAVLRLCGDESEEVMHRGFVCCMNIVNAPGDTGKKGVVIAKEAGAVDVLKEALKRTKNGQVLQIGIEVLKKLV